MAQAQEKKKWRSQQKLSMRKPKCWDFPGGPLVKNPPYNAGDVGLIPGQGTEILHAVGQLSPRHNY